MGKYLIPRGKEMIIYNQLYEHNTTNTVTNKYISIIKVFTAGLITVTQNL